MADLERIERVMQEYGCSREDAERYLDLREEGYSQYQSAVMAGLTDPHHPEEQ
ncbi:hypothetical protein [Achromobacter aegrifaciens]|uniref:hypothetical protein n=1 Tax=Achromobacter aegrifaciens TaxID=1287736 RepID=UPI0028AC33AA|nr:hypothetical protein [Achromobacter aegrifaciens]